MEPFSTDKWSGILRPRKRVARSSAEEIVKVLKYSASKAQSIQKRRSTLTILTLPFDVQLKILEYLNPRDLFVLRRVSEDFEAMLQDCKIWKAYEIWDNKMTTFEVIADLKRMPLLRSISIYDRLDCDLLLRQISLSNKRIETLFIFNCTGGSRTNYLASANLTRILQRCVKLRRIRIHGSHFTGYKFYELLGMAIPRICHFYVSCMRDYQYRAFIRELEKRIVIDELDCPYYTLFKTYSQQGAFHSGINALYSNFDFVVNEKNKILALYGNQVSLRFQFKTESTS